MIGKEKGSDNDIAKLYYSCSVFKKYYSQNLWFGSFDEFNNIQYCKNYIYKRINFLIHIYLVKHFNLSFILFLYKSPRFIKFVESGFCRYLDSHFLISFYNNRYTFCEKSKINFFIQDYFHRHIKEHFKLDLLNCIFICICEAMPHTFKIKLVGGAKSFNTSTNCIILNNKLSFKQKANCFFLKNKEYYSISGRCFSLTPLKTFFLFDNNYKSKINQKSVLIKDLKKCLQKNTGALNIDVYTLVYLSESLEDFNNIEKFLGFHKKKTQFFKNSLIETRLYDKKETFKVLSTFFQRNFLQYGYKNKMSLKPFSKIDFFFFNSSIKTIFENRALKVDLKKKKEQIFIYSGVLQDKLKPCLNLESDLWNTIYLCDNNLANTVKVSKYFLLSLS